MEERRLVTANIRNSAKILKAEGTTRLGPSWVSLIDEMCDRIDAIEAENASLQQRVEAREREKELYQQLCVFKDAKAAALNAPPDYQIAAYQLRDLPLTKEAGFLDLVWAMDKEGNVSRGDWEFLRDQWLEAWRTALAAAQEQGEG